MEGTLEGISGGVEDDNGSYNREEKEEGKKESTHVYGANNVTGRS